MAPAFGATRCSSCARGGRARWGGKGGGCHDSGGWEGWRIDAQCEHSSFELLHACICTRVRAQASRGQRTCTYTRAHALTRRCPACAPLQKGSVAAYEAHHTEGGVDASAEAEGKARTDMGATDAGHVGVGVGDDEAPDVREERLRVEALGGDCTNDPILVR